MQFWRYGRSREVVVEPVGPTAADIDAAYRQGRSDERARRKSHPIAGFFVFVLAIVGAAVVALAVANGSFSRGGQVADQHLAVAADEAALASRTAAAEAGESVSDAGQSLRSASALN